mmetsp:Transcript_10688/g.28079  ORF Transcript_10688/g.28079 Transcript_10688/m.28079 type:complete len:529 (+) Transcript_10688:271-1857(+)
MPPDAVEAPDYFNILRDSVSRRERESAEDYGDSAGAALPMDSMNTGYYKKFFVQKNKLGRGGFGAVYRADHILDGVFLATYAVKKIPVGDSHAWLERKLREVKVLEKVHHPNVVDYKHSWLEMHSESEFAPEVPFLFILMEFANRGSLAAALGAGPEGGDGERRYLSDGEVVGLLRGICCGLGHLHEEGIIHCDLKPENILLSQTRRARDPVVLISDFGVSRECGGEEGADASGNTGTLPYIPPEVVLYGAKPDEKGDVWSLGAMLFVMCYSELPFECETLDEAIEQFQKVSDIEIPAFPARPRFLVDLIKSAMQWDPEERPTVASILELEWMKTEPNGFTRELSGNALRKVKVVMTQPPPTKIKRRRLSARIEMEPPLLMDRASETPLPVLPSLTPEPSSGGGSRGSSMSPVLCAVCVSLRAAGAFLLCMRPLRPSLFHVLPLTLVAASRPAVNAARVENVAQRICLRAMPFALETIWSLFCYHGQMCCDLPPEDIFPGSSTLPGWVMASCVVFLLDIACYYKEAKR